MADSSTTPFDFNNPATSIPTSEHDPAAPPSGDSPHNGSDHQRDSHDSHSPPHDHPHAGPVIDAHGRVLNPRSCVTCRRRKVKCDKVHPCSNCAKAHIECIFPSPGRAPRKPRKHHETRDSELLARLRRLEGVVKGMGVEVPAKEGHRASSDSTSNVSSPHSHGDHKSPDSLQYQSPGADHRLENKFGRLVVSEGRSRYVNTSFWASLSNEVEDLKGILNDETDDEDDGTPGHSHHPPQNSHGWIFGLSSQNVDMLVLHPIPMQIETYWNIFKDRVDPLVKILHIPTLSPTVLAAASHLGNLSKGFEALLFAIYYGATTSLTPDECLKMLGEERNTLLSRYRFGVEQALARANILVAEELVIHQAFAIFLMSLRRNSDARVIWTLTGLLVRIAQTVGLHRDGTHFNLSPFEIEMRRRLWWQIFLIDGRASEDHGCDPVVFEYMFDTLLPLNINDTDIAPNMTAPPKERRGCTEMSFSLIRYTAMTTIRRLTSLPAGKHKVHLSEPTLQDKERWIEECHAEVEEKFLKNCDMTVPFYWVTATVGRLILSKMWLVVYHPYQRSDTDGTLTDDIRDKLFITSLESLEYSSLLESETRTMKWGWLFRTYMQWHALAFLLAELCKRTTGPLVDRAWVAVSHIRNGRWGEINADGRTGYLWKPLNKLLDKAQQARAKGLEEKGMTDIVDESRMLGKAPQGSVADYLTKNATVTASPRSGLPEPLPVQGPQYSFFSMLGSQDFDSPEFTGKLPEKSDQTNESDNLQPNADLPQTVNGVDGLEDITNDFAGPQRTGTWPGTQNMNMITTGGAGLGSVDANPGLDDPSAFAGLDTGADSFADPSVTFTADGELDWTNFDNMVRQFGMDVDPPAQGDAAASQINGRGGMTAWNPAATPGVNRAMPATGWF